ncbi:MAG: response regulator, partial [Myxococcota bacterium]
MSSSVLIVEDNQALAENIGELFEDSGAEVSLVPDGARAIHFTETHPVDLAVIDLRLPGTHSGADLIPLLRETVPEAEIILVTGNATLDTAIAAVRHGVFAYVIKPFDPEHLLALGQRALAQVTLKREKQSLARELADSEALHRGVLDGAEALIVGLDAEGAISFCNRFASEVSGFGQEHTLGKGFSGFFACVETESKIANAVQSALRGLTVRQLQTRMPTRDGSMRTVRWSLRPVSTKGPMYPSVVAIGQDVSE